MNRTSSTPPGLVLTEALWLELEAAYATPPRHYHTLSHAVYVAEWVLRAHAEQGFERPREAYVAALFHDAIYDVRNKHNERDSAALAVQAIERHTLPVDAVWVTQLVLRTAQHGQSQELTADEALFLDCDIAVLGADAQTYALYEQGVRAEYLTAVPAELYQVGRRRFLEKLLAAPHLFATAYFRERFEGAARANLTLALSQP